MSEPFSLSAFVDDPQNHRTPKLEHLEALLDALATSERPRSIRTLFWFLLRTLRMYPALYAAISEHWRASEADVAQLLEDAGPEETETVLSLDGVSVEYSRLWALSDDAGLSNLVKASSPSSWQLLSLAPMAALVAERQLDELLAAVERERQWMDPSEILVGEVEFDVDVLLCIGQARLIEGGWGPSLDQTIFRLLSYAERQESV